MIQVIVAYKTSQNELLKKAGELKNRMEKSFKDLATDKNSTFPFVLHATAGGETHGLLIEKGLSTFALHTAMRKAFSGAFKGAEGDVIVDLALLDAKDTERALEALASLSVLSAWTPVTYGNKAKDKKAPKAISVQVISKLKSQDSNSLSARGLKIGEAVNRVRTLADMPANQLNPGNYRKIVQDFAKERKMKFEFMNIAALKKMKAGAFLAVVQADPDTESGIVHLTVPSKLKKPRQRICLVGKGLCYDTGGYNIKTGSYMNGMHRDMTGSAIAFSTTALLAELHPELEIHCFMAIAENLISPTAYKPDEVAIASNGMSIEVMDTDAEGRMALSDTLAIASLEKPDVIIDFATLTGAAVRSLDTRRAAIFSNRPALAALAVKTGEASGERTWSFPIGEDYRENLKSDVADILQCAHIVNSDHIYAATFLSEFVAKDVPWVHMDLCPAENKGGLGLVTENTTGFGPRWALEFVEALLTKA